MLADGVTADVTDKYCQIGKSTVTKSIKHFYKAIRVQFGDHYL
jgi:hypothetical protein